MQAKVSTKRAHGSGSVRPTKGRNWEGRARIEGKQVPFNLGPRRECDPKGLTKTQAEAALRKAIENYSPPKDGIIPSFSEIAAAHIRKRELLNRKPNTTKEYWSYKRLYFDPEFGDRRIDAITSEEIDRLQTKLLRKAKAGSVKIWMAVLHGIFESAVPKYIVTNPVALIERPKVESSDEVHYLTEDQLMAVLAEIPDDELGKVERVLYLVGAMTGLRRGELIGLRWRHVDWLVGRKIRVLINTVDGKDGTPKSGKGRTVPLPDSLILLLEAWSKQTKWNRDDDRVFSHPLTGRGLDASKLTKRFRKAIIKGEVGEFRDVIRKGKLIPNEPVLTLHSLRHTFGVLMAKNPKVSLVEIQSWMGHSDIKTTMRYAQFQPGESAAERAEETFAGFPSTFPHSPQTTPDPAVPQTT